MTLTLKGLEQSEMLSRLGLLSTLTRTPIIFEFDISWWWFLLLIIVVFCGIAFSFLYCDLFKTKAYLYLAPKKTAKIEKGWVDDQWVQFEERKRKTEEIGFTDGYEARELPLVRFEAGYGDILD